MKCIEREVSFRGAVFLVKVYTSSSDICSEVLNAESRGVTGILEFVNRHGGCCVESENPLRISSSDRSTLVEVSPANIVAKMIWGTVVKKAKDYCK